LRKENLSYYLGLEALERCRGLQASDAWLWRLCRYAQFLARNLLDDARDK
jgi:hypothetical protein